MKARGGSGVWPVYEDFNPTSEWQDEAQSHNLIIYLPGFVKEQLRVSTHGRNTIRVGGERLVGGNKWSCFLEDFEVPQNSDMNSVRAKFHDSALTITIPKKMVHEPTPEKEPQPPKASETQHTTTAPFKDTTTEEESTSPEEDGAAGAFEEDKKRPQDMSGKIKLKPDNGPQTKEEKVRDDADGVFTKKGIAQLNEERQLMVNMGVAVLVIVSLTALVTYKFVSADNKK